MVIILFQYKQEDKSSRFRLTPVCATDIFTVWKRRSLYFFCFLYHLCWAPWPGLSWVGQIALQLTLIFLI